MAKRDDMGGEDGGGEDESELFEAGELIDGKYEVVRRLGRGGYGPPQKPCRINNLGNISFFGEF